MDKYELKSILEQICEEDFSEFSEPAKHRFRLRNRLRIRRILAETERQGAARTSPRRFSRRVAVVAIVLILLAVTAISATAIMLLKGFSVKEHKDNVQLFAAETADAPSVIEETYYLPQLPEGYVFQDSVSTEVQKCTIYINDFGGFISLDQHVKAEYATHYDDNQLIPIKINEHDGVYIDNSTDTQHYSCVVWDNGDYIMQLEGMLMREEIIALAESVKK